MNNFICPSCEKVNEVEWGDLPGRACDDMEYECKSCGLEMLIGWCAEIEVRKVFVGNGDLS